MGSQALRTLPLTEVDEEERFFISGVERVGLLRSTHANQLRRRKIVLWATVVVASLALVALVTAVAVGLSSHPKQDSISVCPRSYNPENADLVFYVIGDWGRSGNDNQQRAARLMASVSQCMRPNFIISTGDNFYPSGLRSTSDLQFNSSFSAVYSAPGLQVPWYAVMGNHDYGDNVDPTLLESGQCLSAPSTREECKDKCCYSPLWQVSSELEARDARWHANMGGVVTKSWLLRGAGDRLDVLLVDTVPLISPYLDRPWAAFLGGVKTQNASDIKAQLYSKLNESYQAEKGTDGGPPARRWRLVVGHHPVRSYGSHCSQPDSYDCKNMSFLAPWLKDFRVAAYLSGHDHDLQLIKSLDDPVHYVVSGAGSDIREGEFTAFQRGTTAAPDDGLFLEDDNGFLAVVISGDTMWLHFYTAGKGPGPAYTRKVAQPAW